MKQEQIDNNFNYHKPNEDQITSITAIREQCKTTAETINFRCPESREKSVAITKVEEAMMWANAAIAREEKESGSVSPFQDHQFTEEVKSEYNSGMDFTMPEGTKIESHNKPTDWEIHQDDTNTVNMNAIESLLYQVHMEMSREMLERAKERERVVFLDVDLDRERDITPETGNMKKFIEQKHRRKY